MKYEVAIPSIFRLHNKYSFYMISLYYVGEISAGKSSLLNFLIGRDILPTSTLETKSIPCRLRYASEKRAKLVDDSGNVIEDINYDENENDEALNRLRKIIKEGELVPGLSYVEIFLNECSLEVSYVDLYF